MNSLKHRLDRLALAIEAQDTAAILAWFDGLTPTQQGALKLALDRVDAPELTDDERLDRIAAILDRAAHRRTITGLESLTDQELEDIIRERKTHEQP